MRSRRITILALISIINLIPTACYAWSNYFRVVNNFNFPLILSINPSIASVDNLCGGSINNIEVGPHAVSCEFQFNDSRFRNAGTLTLSKKEDPNSYCTYQYSYTESPFSYFDMRSEVFSEPVCQGNLKATELSVINPHNQALPRTLVGNVALGMDQGKSYEITHSLAEADCGGQGGDNCIIASPDLNASYVNKGSTLAQAIVLQNELDRYEPLNFEQMMGAHNAAISQQYTTSTSEYNMSHSDPDSYLSLTDQLNAGLRQIELDIEWYNNAVTICHDHVSKSLQGILCAGNFPLTTALNEMKIWIEKNPNALVFLYLDVNLPLTGHVFNLDTDLALLEPYIFTPTMAIQYFKVPNNTLPAYQLTQDALIHQFKKNIIITNDDDVANLKNSQYVFVNVQNVNVPPLEEDGVDTFLQSKYSSCKGVDKYTNIKNLYGDDPNHFNLLRLNADRTIINYISCVGDMPSDHYVDYYTTRNLPNMLNCPFNIFSTNMFGFTCDANSCNHHPTDPRLYSFLWSWELGYPLQAGGSNIAYVNSMTGHFENMPLKVNTIYSVLCVKPFTQLSPLAPLPWYIKNINITHLNSINVAAQSTCQKSGGFFAVPTTSYWMDDALNVIKATQTNPYNVIVNYQNIHGQWIPNAGYMKKGKQVILKTHSLLKVKL